MTNSKVIPAILPDHDLVQIHFAIPESAERGPGFWKLNSEYLNNKEYANLLKLTINNSLKHNA